MLELGLDRVYVPLEATSPEEHDSLPDELLIHSGTPTKPVYIDQVLGLGNRLVITGGSGSGKTTVLLYVAWVLATAILEKDSSLALERLGLDGPLPLPIYVPLAAMQSIDAC